MALLVNERTLLPVVMPLAPAATLAKRFPAALKGVLQSLDLPADFIQAEMDDMGEVVYAKTANRSLIGMLNEFSFLGEAFRGAYPGALSPTRSYRHESTHHLAHP